MHIFRCGINFQKLEKNIYKKIQRTIPGWFSKDWDGIWGSWVGCWSQFGHEFVVGEGFFSGGRSSGLLKLADRWGGCCVFHGPGKLLLHSKTIILLSKSFFFSYLINFSHEFIVGEALVSGGWEIGFFEWKLFYAPKLLFCWSNQKFFFSKFFINIFHVGSNIWKLENVIGKKLCGKPKAVNGFLFFSDGTKNARQWVNVGSTCKWEWWIYITYIT